MPTTANVAISHPALPTAPLNVTSITKDAGATVSFYAPVSSGTGAVTSYTVTPYIAGSPQTATTVPVGSLTSLTTGPGAPGATALQANITGLTNSTAYTFKVKASSAYGTGPESAASGANTPLAGLVFGDDFNGPAGQNLDPEWWVYSRCGYIAQSEVEWYLPGQCVLDGAGNLLLIATHTGHSGTSYPSDGNTTRNQTWLSGACQSNVRTYQPTTGNTMTFESRFQLCPDAGGGIMWPGLFWLEGQDYLTAWKTDPQQASWDNAGKAEIDIAEWNGGGVTNYGNNTWGNTADLFNVNTAIDFSAAMHTFKVQWKPGVSTSYFRDGTQTHQTTTSGVVASSSTSFFLLLYLQIKAGAASNQQCTIDYIRVYDQNLG